MGRPAKDISLLDIASIFEQTATPSVCPFGEGWCGTGEPCPLHDKIHGILRHHEKFIQNTRLSIFAKKQKTQDLPQKKMTALQRRYAGVKKISNPVGSIQNAAEI